MIDARGARSVALVGVALVVGVAALYAPCIDHPFLFDDAVQITENPSVTRGAALRAYFVDPSTTSSRADYNTRIYRPLRQLAFRAVVVAGGVNARAFGVANLLLYALSTVLVLLLALRTSGDRVAAGWAAALWAAAPVHVEPVLYASALGDQLSLVLELGGLLFGIALVADVEANAAKSFARGVASVVLVAGAMLAKEMAVTAVGLLGLGLLLSGGQPLRQRRAWLLLAAHALTALAYLALRTSIVGRVGQEDVTASSVGHGLTEAPVLLVEYARLAVAPLGHRTAYVVPPPSLGKLVATLAGIAIVVAIAWWIDRKRGAPPGLRFGLGWFALSLLPVLHVVPLWADLADRFALVPSIGLALTTAALLTLVPDGRRRGYATVACGALLVLYAAGTILEARAWRDDFSLWAHAVDGEPRSSLARANLGTLYLGRGQPKEALEELDAARELGRGNAEVELRRGMALDALGRAWGAEAALRVAIERDPQLGRAHALLGDLLRRRGRLEDAQLELARAQALSPDHPSTAMLEAALATTRGQPADAVRAYRRLAERFPADGRYRYLEATASLEAKRPDDAEAAARACLAADAAQPQCRCALGRALAARGRTDEARAALELALAALPESEERVTCRAAREALR